MKYWQEVIINLLPNANYDEVKPAFAPYERVQPASLQQNRHSGLRCNSQVLKNELIRKKRSGSGSQFLNHLLRIRHPPKSDHRADQRSLVQLFGDGRLSIGNAHDLEIAHEPIPGSRFTANVGVHAGDHQSGHPHSAQI